MHGLSSLVNGPPATHLVGLGVEGLVALGKLWSILVMVLWSSDGPGFLGGWVDLLAVISGLLCFLFELLKALAHLLEHVEILELKFFIIGVAKLHNSAHWVISVNSAVDHEFLELKCLFTKNWGTRWRYEGHLFYSFLKKSL